MESNSNHNKVYINPNFNRTLLNDWNVTNRPPMHINPKFSHHLPNAPAFNSNNVNKPRIYINPNFIKSQTEYHQSQHVIPHEGTQSYAGNVNRYQLPSNQNQLIKIQENALPILMSKSRYSLVRSKQNKVPEIKAPEKITKTFKVNKYKLVQINDIQNKLASNKCLDKTANKITANKQKRSHILQQKIKGCLSSTLSSIHSRNRYKFIKQNPPVVASNSGLKKQNVNVVRNLNKSSQRLKINTIRKSLKKNNIPCPLFKKYGKCLRDIRGNCEFLHDKKHVSICRKFIKGVCHDNACLLSHDLTDKKMPTCYFYLKGMCTKENCPYLHIKLNDKTKICTDFLKGYCEKGDKCLNRHINICPDMAVTGVCLKKKCPHPHKSTDIKYNKNTKTMCVRQQRNVKASKTKPIKTDSIEPKQETDVRYYKEKINAPSGSDICEVIKPTRCKLGDLPSFIEL